MQLSYSLLTIFSVFLSFIVNLRLQIHLRYCSQVIYKTNKYLYIKGLLPECSVCNTSPQHIA